MNSLPASSIVTDIYKLLSLPTLPLPPPPAPLLYPDTIGDLLNKEVPLDLSSKPSATSPSSPQRKCKVGQASSTSHPHLHHPHHHHHHHHHHASGKQPIPRCFECKRLFPSLWELNAHFLREHQSALQKELTQNRSWKTCSLENIPMHQLQSTLRKGAVERTGYPCPHCDYFAKWPTELQKHIMVHSKERPHQCIICGLTYKWKWDLGRHFDKSHNHTVNPYKKTCLSVKAAATSRHQQQQQSLKAKNRLGTRPCGRKEALGSTTIQKLPRTIFPPPPLSTYLPFPLQFGSFFRC
ncbi:unnamed protein product [Mesocestoides corti]|uniref:C2H2-type domain-containing protein n=1 Tax=Mesocestoides corti TaxID=53468 RepID=A0A0R3U315_MESCO|nr:unnamed protein product [Mesocestoides corti]